MVECDLIKLVCILEFILSKKLVTFELETDLLMSLESLSDSLIKVKNGQDCYFKWSIIFSHTALQSAMCLSLITCSNLLVRKRGSYNNNSSDLDNIEWLYLKLQNTEFLTSMGSKIIPEVKGELIKIKRLQTIRNTFIHQQPDLYIFTFEELYELVQLSIALIHFLVSNSERMSLSINKNELENIIFKIENQLTIYSKKAK